MCRVLYIFFLLDVITRVCKLVISGYSAGDNLYYAVIITYEIYIGAFLFSVLKLLLSGDRQTAMCNWIEKAIRSPSVFLKSFAAGI